MSSEISRGQRMLADIDLVDVEACVHYRLPMCPHNWRNVPSIDRYGTIWNKILRGSSEEVLAGGRLDEIDWAFIMLDSGIGSRWHDPERQD